jgi:MoxR-like ATPase
MIGVLDMVQRVMTESQLLELQAAVRGVFVDPALIDYGIRMASATRNPASVGLRDLARYISYGASPRASIYLALAARALALVRGRNYALPEDMQSLAPDVLRHRLVLSYEALGDNVTPDAVVRAILAAIPPPEVVLRDVGVPDDHRRWAPPTR